MNKIRKTLVKISFYLIGLGLFASITAYFFGATKDSKWRTYFLKEMEGITSTQEQNVIESISLNLNYGKIVIIKGSEFSIVTNNIKKSNFENNVKDGVWVVGEKKKWKPSLSSGLWPFYLGKKGMKFIPTITMTIPEDYSAEKIKINLGVGTIRIEELEALESASIKVDMGKIIVRDIEAKNAELLCGTGIIYAKGTITGKSNISCSKGKVALELIGDETDYSYFLDCNLGEVNINGKENGALGSVYEIRNNESENHLFVNCGIGEIGFSIKPEEIETTSTFP